MAMHKHPRNDKQHPAGQVHNAHGIVTLQGHTLEKEIEQYLAEVERKQVMKMCRCNDECINLCETCPNKE